MEHRDVIKKVLLQHFKRYEGDMFVEQNLVCEFIARLCIKLNYLELLETTKTKDVYYYSEYSHGIIEDLFEIKKSALKYTLVNAISLSTEKELYSYADNAIVEVRKLFLDEIINSL